jgi:hypothetical protein
MGAERNVRYPCDQREIANEQLAAQGTCATPRMLNAAGSLGSSRIA